MPSSSRRAHHQPSTSVIICYGGGTSVYSSLELNFLSRRTSNPSPSSGRVGGLKGDHSISSRHTPCDYDLADGVNTPAPCQSRRTNSVKYGVSSHVPTLLAVGIMCSAKTSQCIGRTRAHVLSTPRRVFGSSHDGDGATLGLTYGVGVSVLAAVLPHCGKNSSTRTQFILFTSAMASSLGVSSD